MLFRSMTVPTKALLQSCISQFGEKTVDAILRLPDEDITWVVYNANLVPTATNLIIALRGVEYFSKYIRVASRDVDDIASCGEAKVYYDPKMFELLGNGYD